MRRSIAIFLLVALAGCDSTTTTPVAPVPTSSPSPSAVPVTEFFTKGRAIEIETLPVGTAAHARQPLAGGAQLMFVKGVDYSPAPICSGPLDNPLGASNETIWSRDLPQLRKLGANAIKVYNANVTINDPLDKFLDAAYNGGRKPIYTILSIFFAADIPLNSGAVADLSGQYRKLAKTYGAKPGLLGISIGSEVNSDQFITNPAWWAGMSTIAKAAKAGLTDAGHAEKIITTSLVDDGLQTVIQGEKFGFPVDAWGVNVYRGSSFGSLWREVRKATSKPFLLGEWGTPASWHPGGDPNTATEFPKKEMPLLTGYVSGLATDAYDNSTEHAGPGSGGFYFEWNDEWWKAGKGDNCKQLPNGVINKNFPGGFNDEAWYGLSSIGPGTPNVLTKRPTWTKLQETWSGQSAPD